MWRRRTYRTLARGAGIAAALLGATALIGWLFRNDALKTVIPGATFPLKPNIAAGMLLCGMALALLARKKVSHLTRVAVACLATAVIILSGLTLGEFLFGWNLGIDRGLLGMGMVEPGRMPPITALCFALLGVSLLTASRLIQGRSQLPFVAGLGGILLLAGAVPLIGLLLGFLVGPGWNFMGMDVSSVVGALTFLILGGGLLALLGGHAQLKWSLDRWTSAGFASGFASLILAAGLFHNFTLRMLEAERQVDHTHQVLAEIEEIEVGVSGLEMGQRGYIITGNEHFLADRKAQQLEVQAHVEKLQNLAALNSHQRPLMRQLELIISERFRQADQIITARRERGFSAAQEMVGSDSEIRAQVQNRLVTEEIESDENQRLNQRQSDSAASSQRASLILPIGVLLCCTILSVGLSVLNAGMGQRKEAEDSLRQSEEGMRAILDSALDCIITMDDGGRVVEFNPAAEKTFGYRRQEAIGQLLSDLIIPPSLRERHQKGLAHYLATGEGPALGRRLELSAVRRDGTEFPVELAIIRIGTQKPPMFTGFIRDITEGQAAAEKLAAQEKQYRLLFEDNPSPMWVFDVQSLEILAVNQAAIASYGYSREEFLARTLRDIRPGEDVPALIQSVSEAHAPAEYGGEWRHLRKDGTIINAAVYSSPTVFNGREARMTLAVDHTARAEAERKVRESEATLALAQHVAGVGSWQYQFTEDGRLDQENLVWSEEAYRIFGLSPADPISTEIFFHAVHLDDRTALASHFTAFLASNAALKTDYRIIRPDGTERVIYAVAERIFDPETGKPTRIVGTFLDITERRMGEKKLREADEKYRVIFDNALEGIFQSTPDGRFISSNPAFARMLGFENPQELIRERNDITRQSYSDPTKREEFKRLLDENGVVNDFEIEVKRKDGSRRWISENVRVVRNPAGKATYYEGTAQDITERKEAEDRLREQARLIDLAQDAIMVRDMDDRVEFWNHGAEVLYGWTAAEVYGRCAADFLHQEDPAAVLAADLTLSETGVWSGECRHMTQRGDTVIVRSRRILVRDEQGVPKSKLVINTDITEQKKIEEQFLRAQRLESIGTLASGVAHDLNNILLPIMMAATVLREVIDSAERDKFLDIVETSAQRGANIIKQVLTFARGADGDHILLQPIYLLEEIASIAGQTFPKSIALRTNYDEHIRPLEADPTQLHQVLLNLCINARDAMPNGGQLCLGAENFDVDEHYASITPGATVGPHVMLQVTDTGSGIPKDVIDKIFDPFFTTKNVGEGTGLGLSTVAGIVKSHGGFIKLDSEPSRTSFKIFLPAKETLDTVNTLEAAKTVPRGDGQTILVVDDEPSIREVAQLILESHGYTVLVAEDGPDALALFAQQAGKVAAVVTDLAMPLMNGTMLVRALHRIQPGLKIIVSTGRNDDPEEEELLALKVDGYLFKPFSTLQLLLKLSQVLSSGLQDAA